MRGEVERAFDVTGWAGTGGTTLGFRFGASNAKRFVERDWTEIVIELDGDEFPFPIRDAFWRGCPEVRGKPITEWLRRHGLAGWSKGAPPRLRLVHGGGNRFRALVPRP